ncbi:MAG: hypothetical protein ACFCBW_11305 [Candidatus Competibacterales bacterium]
MAEDYLERICDVLGSSRDTVVDELNDMLEAEQYSAHQEAEMIATLVDHTAIEPDPAVRESLFNLLSQAYDRGVQPGAIEAMVGQQLDTLEPGSMIHALGILGRSGRAAAKAHLEPYLESANPAVKAAAEEACQQLAAPRD